MFTQTIGRLPGYNFMLLRNIEIRVRYEVVIFIVFQNYWLDLNVKQIAISTYSTCSFKE